MSQAGGVNDSRVMRTFGIEEEFQFLHPSTLLPADAGAAVLRRLARTPWAAVAHREFLASQIEHASVVLSTLDEGRSALVGFRRAVARSASRLGLVAAGVGTAPDCVTDPRLTDDVVRYGRIAEDMLGIIADHQVSGLHIHVAVPDRAAGVRALNAARPWMPLLTAFAANSPLWRGRDSGYDSWRTVLLRRWTTAGCPPVFADADDYDRRVDALIGVGGTFDRALIMWNLRLSDHLPTIEFRMADAQLDAESSLLVAALCRALVTRSLESSATAMEQEAPPGELLSAAILHSARHGLRESVYDPSAGALVPAEQAVRGLVFALSDVLAAAGDLDAVVDGTERVLADGTGAERQRRAFLRGGAPGLRRLLERELVAEEPQPRGAGDGMGTLSGPIGIVDPIAEVPAILPANPSGGVRVRDHG